jgi:hypothetical protein
VCCVRHVAYDDNRRDTTSADELQLVEHPLQRRNRPGYRHLADVSAGCRCRNASPAGRALEPHSHFGARVTCGPDRLPRALDPSGSWRPGGRSAGLFHGAEGMTRSPNDDPQKPSKNAFPATNVSKAPRSIRDAGQDLVQCRKRHRDASQRSGSCLCQRRCARTPAAHVDAAR